MIRIWFGVSVIWTLGLYAFAWLDMDRIWPPPIPTDLFAWLTWSAIFIGPPLVVLLLGYTIVPKPSKQQNGTQDEE